MTAEVIIKAGVILLLTGFILMFAGILLSAKNSDTTVRGGGVVFLGPIPLIFGSDRNSAITISLLGLALMIAVYLLFKR